MKVKTIELKVSEEMFNELKAYADKKDENLDYLLLKALIDRIEDEEHVEIANKIMESEDLSKLIDIEDIFDEFGMDYEK